MLLFTFGPTISSAKSESWFLILSHASSFKTETSFRQRILGNTATNSFVGKDFVVKACLILYNPKSSKLPVDARSSLKSFFVPFIKTSLGWDITAFIQRQKRKTHKNCQQIVIIKAIACRTGLNLCVITNFPLTSHRPVRGSRRSGFGQHLFYMNKLESVRLL